MGRKICFSDLEKIVPAAPGIYEIHTRAEIPLKVGISVNLRKRLIQHRASRQSALKFKSGDQHCNPSDVRSKGSILAKHLYFDRSLVTKTEYDLELEEGRRKFLEERCYLVFEPTANKEAARKLEKMRESERQFRYLGKVSER